MGNGEIPIKREQSSLLELPNVRDFEPEEAQNPSLNRDFPISQFPMCDEYNK